MNFRWYITGFIIALAFFGMSLERSTVANQEIIVQFDVSSISDNDANRAISKITNQLKAIGVTNVQVSELHDGKLKVTYYSSIDASVIKNILYEQHEFQFGTTAFNDKGNTSRIPFKNTSNTYKLDVIELQKNYASDLGLQGLPVEFKVLKDQYLNQTFPLVSSEVNFKVKQTIEGVAYKNYRNVSLLIDTSSHKIPEVRAGPLT